jgi:hypothetical protein
MTEDEWLTCLDIDAMMASHQGKWNNRKARLFAVASCLLIFPQMTTHRCRSAVERALEVGALLADKKVSERSRREAAVAVRDARKYANLRAGEVSICEAAYASVSRPPRWVRGVVYINADLCNLTASDRSERSQILEKSYRASQARISDLLRHIVGNPFRAPPTLSFVPSHVRELAEAVYQQCTASVGPLHDALLDLGLTELAEHFSHPADWHPKGCWAVDLLTGRTST